MGLLDGNLDPQTASTLALAGGLLSPGSFGQGLTSGLAARQAVLSNAQDMDIKKQTLEMSKLQYAAALRNQNLINDYLSQGVSGGATPQQPSMPSTPSVMAGAPGTTPPSSPTSPMNPNMQPSAPASPASSSGPFGGLPSNQWIPELAFNGGKGIGDMVAKYNTPTSLRPGGYAYFQGKGMVQLPQVPEGYTAVQAPDGSFSMQPVPGGVAALGASSAAKASGPAGFKQTEIIGADGKKYTVFNSQLPGFNGAPPSLSPPIPMGPTPPPASAAISPPGSVIPPAVQAQRDAEGAQVAPPGPNGAPAPDFGTTDLAALRASIAREQSLGPAHAANVQTLTQLLQQRQGGAAPAGGVQTGYAPGELTGANNAQDTMTASYKAVSGANNSAQTVQARLDQIAQFSKGAILGGDTGWRDQVNNLLSIAGVSDRATDRKTAGDLLDKNASQIALALGTGSQGTDALRSLAAAANPSRHMTQPAINEAVAQLQASAQVQQAKAQLLTPIYNAGNPSAYNSTEQQFDKNADYRVFQIAKDTQGMSPPQIQAYFQQRGYTPQQITQLQAQRKNLMGLGVQF